MSLTPNREDETLNVEKTAGSVTTNMSYQQFFLSERFYGKKNF